MPLAKSNEFVGKNMNNTNVQTSQCTSSEAPKTVSMAATEQVAGVGVSGIRAQELDM